MSDQTQETPKVSADVAVLLSCPWWFVRDGEATGLGRVDGIPSEASAFALGRLCDIQLAFRLPVHCPATGDRYGVIYRPTYTGKKAAKEARVNGGGDAV